MSMLKWRRRSQPAKFRLRHRFLGWNPTSGVGHFNPKYTRPVGSLTPNRLTERRRQAVRQLRKVAGWPHSLDMPPARISPHPAIRFIVIARGLDLSPAASPARLASPAS